MLTGLVGLAASLVAHIDADSWKALASGREVILGSAGHRDARLMRWPCSNVDAPCSAEMPVYSPDLSAKKGGQRYCWPDIFPMSVHPERKFNLPDEAEWCVLPRAQLAYEVAASRPSGAAPACAEHPERDANRPRACVVPQEMREQYPGTTYPVPHGATKDAKLKKLYQAAELRPLLYEEDIIFSWLGLGPLLGQVSGCPLGTPVVSVGRFEREATEDELRPIVDESGGVHFPSGDGPEDAEQQLERSELEQAELEQEGGEDEPTFGVTDAEQVIADT